MRHPIPRASGELRAAGRSLVELGTVDDGLLAIQTKLLPERQAVAAQQAALQTIGVDLREQVSKLNESAEAEATSTAALSAQAIDSSRLWLILIAAASLILAGLIVWLFVLRYVVRRLTELRDSMLAIARGDLATPIPARRPRRARRHEPGARGVPRQCPRHPRRQRARPRRRAPRRRPPRAPSRPSSPI